MSTVGDFIKKVSSIAMERNLFGIENPEKFNEEYRRRLDGIVQAVSDENNVPPRLITSLPEETPLGEESQRLFEEFVEWIATPQ
jgi:hypothetical protein